MSSIRPKLRPALSRVVTAAIVVALSVAVLGTSGCKWFRKKDYYAAEESQRPLEFPPTFNAAEADRAVATTASGSVSRSSLPSNPSARALSFTVAGDRTTVFGRVGDALSGISGVSIASRAQLLGAFDVDYEGQKFLIRITEADGRSTVAAVDPRGLPADHQSASNLIAALKTALGGS